jgi:hypothetical protein
MCNIIVCAVSIIGLLAIHAAHIIKDLNYCYYYFVLVAVVVTIVIIFQVLHNFHILFLKANVFCHRQGKISVQTIYSSGDHIFYGAPFVQMLYM